MRANPHDPPSEVVAYRPVANGRGVVGADGWGWVMGLWFKSDWVNPFGETHYNWIDFAFIHLSGEFDNRFGNIEFHAALLGFHIGGQWNVGRGDLELQASLKKMMGELESGDARISISLSEYNDLKRRAGEAE